MLGGELDAHIEQIEKFAEAGYDHVYVHQIGPYQEGFLRFYEEEIIPKLAGVREVARSGG